MNAMGFIELTHRTGGVFCIGLEHIITFSPSDTAGWTDLDLTNGHQVTVTETYDSIANRMLVLRKGK